jgi:hypothetical protein
MNTHSEARQTLDQHTAACADHAEDGTREWLLLESELTEAEADSRLGQILITIEAAELVADHCICDEA